MKASLAALSLLVVVGSLVGCSGANEPEPAESTDAVQEGERNYTKDRDDFSIARRATRVDWAKWEGWESPPNVILDYGFNEHPFTNGNVIVDLEIGQVGWNWIGPYSSGGGTGLLPEPTSLQSPASESELHIIFDPPVRAVGTFIGAFPRDSRDSTVQFKTEMRLVSSSSTKKTISSPSFSQSQFAAIERGEVPFLVGELTEGISEVYVAARTGAGRAATPYLPDFYFVSADGSQGVALPPRPGRRPGTVR